MNNSSSLLTIAIPTYNRAEELSVLLSALLMEQAFCSGVEVLLSDNNSSDSTRDVIESFIERGLNASYFRNSENIGSSANVVRCFQLASTPFVLIMGDDDVLLPGALTRIVAALRDGDVGLLFLTSYPFYQDHVREQPKNPFRTDLVYFHEPRAFLSRTLLNLTFLSSVVVNRACLPATYNVARFQESYLPQLAWVSEVLFSQERHAALNQFVVAGKADNSGGYGLCEVFGVNLQAIIDAFVESGRSSLDFEPLRAYLMRRFLPTHLLELRTQEHGFVDENFDTVLRPIFGNRLDYWLCLYPVLTLPRPLASGWLAVITAVDKIRNALTRLGS